VQMKMDEGIAAQSLTPELADWLNRVR
jgi:hypothetical protein